MRETWNISPSVPGLELSDQGRVRVVPYHKEMPYGGHRIYGGLAWAGALAKDGVRPRRIIRFRGATHKVHRLVCEAFHGPEPFANADVMHLNGDTTDNRPANLRWATRKEIIRQRPIERPWLAKRKRKS